MPDPSTVLRALRASQLRLAAVVGELAATDLEHPSYDVGWSVADVLSHLGSQAEIFMTFIDAGLDGTPPPSNESFGPIWDTWNAKAPGAKAADALVADASFLERLETLDEDTLARFELSLFGMEVDAARLLGMRLGEHALHTWDIAVAFDDTALLAPDATELLIEALGGIVTRAAQPHEGGLVVSVVTSSPKHELILDTAAPSLVPGTAPDGSGELELSSEALVRLVYGRLDDDHLGSPAPTTSGFALDQLRTVFPGF